MGAWIQQPSGLLGSMGSEALEICTQLLTPREYVGARVTGPPFFVAFAAPRGCSLAWLLDSGCLLAGLWEAHVGAALPAWLPCLCRSLRALSRCFVAGSFLPLFLGH